MITRIYLKAISIANTAIGFVFYFMERQGLLKKVDYEIYKSIPEKSKVDLPYPVNYNPTDKSLFDHNTGFETNDLVVYKLKNVNVSLSGIVFKGMNNCWLSFPHTGFRVQYGWLYLLGQYLFNKKQMGKPNVTYVVLFDFWSSNNYYHWLVDALPRLLMVKEEIKLDNYSLLLPETCSKFVLDTLKYFDINNITLVKKDSYFKAESVLLPYYTVGSGWVHPKYINLIKDHLISKIPGGQNKDRIYVSRGKQKARRISNESALIETIVPLGFSIVYFEDLTFEEQVQIVKNAKILVTSHGANITNAMFMPDNTKVMELIRFDKPNFCFWALASITKKKYYYHFCKVVGNDHLLVDIELFKIHLQKVLND